MNTNSQLSVNIFLTEKFLGKCWHESELAQDTDDGYPYWRCSKCQAEPPHNIDLFTPEGFFLLWEKAQKEEWWMRFIKVSQKIKTPLGNTQQLDGEEWLAKLINFLTFPTLLAAYLGWKE